MDNAREFSISQEEIERIKAAAEASWEEDMKEASISRFFEPLYWFALGALISPLFVEAVKTLLGGGI